MPPRLREGPRPVGRVGEVPDADVQDGRDLVVACGRAARAGCASARRRSGRALRASGPVVGPGQLFREQGQRLARDRTPVRAPVARDRDRDRAEGRAAQPVRVLRARRDEPDPEEPAERVEAVGEREDRAGGLARRIVRSGGRTVLVVDRLPHRVRVPLAAGVDAAHDSLQVGEFLDDERVQVRLGQQGRGAHRLDEVGAAGQARDLLGEVLDPRRLLTVVAELVLEGQARKLRQPPLEALLHVRLEEEARVRQARVQHPLAALRDEALAVLGVVHDRDEVRKQALRTAHRDVLLVGAHGGDGDLLGKLQELRRKRAAHETRPFDEVGERVDQIRVRLDLPADFAGKPARGLENPDPAGLGVGLDEGDAELHEIVVGPGHVDLALGENAMAEGPVGRGHAEELEGNDVPAEERHHAAHRPHERALAGAPAHHLRERQRRDDAGNDLREHLFGGTARNRLAGGHGPAARRIDDDEIGDVHLLRLREPLAGLRRLALGVEGGRGRRAEHLGGAVLLALGDPPQHGREAPRRRIRLRGRGREAFLRERVGQAPGELRARRQQRRRRDLLRSDFQKKVLDVHSQVLRNRL